MSDTTTYSNMLEAIEKGTPFRRQSVANGNLLTDDSLQIDLEGPSHATVKRGYDGVWRLTWCNTYGNVSPASGPDKGPSGVPLTEPWLVAVMDGAFS